MAEVSTEERLRRIEAKIEGLCPSCGQKVAGWKPPLGAFAPEAYATLREMGINPSTGHKQDCREAS